jgi:hypothetical protein
VFIVREVLPGKRYKVQREGTNEPPIEYKEHELQKK